MSTYNLNEKVGQDYFEFILDGFKYKMAYPSGKEVYQLSEVASNGDEVQAKVQELQTKLLTASDADKPALEAQLKDYQEKSKLAQQSYIDWCVTYITPEIDSAPEIKQTLLDKSVKYILAFMDMVQTEING